MRVWTPNTVWPTSVLVMTLGMGYLASLSTATPPEPVRNTLTESIPVTPLPAAAMRPAGSPGVTILVADTQTFRGNASKWDPILQSTVKHSGVAVRLRESAVWLVDQRGARSWSPGGSLPGIREPFENVAWNAMFAELSQESASLGGSVVWLVDNGAHPDKLAVSDRLRPLEPIHEVKVTLIWNGSPEDSPTLKSLFPNDANRRYLPTKQGKPFTALAGTLAEEFRTNP